MVNIYKSRATILSRNPDRLGLEAVYLNENITWNRRSDLEINGIECLWIEIVLQNTSNILLCITYRPPDTSSYLHENFNDLLSNMLTKSTNLSKEVIIAGNLNVNYLNKNCNKPFKETLSLYGFKQIISKATRITTTTSSLIDIIATTCPHLISSSGVIPLSIGDHDMVVCIRKMHHKKYKPSTITCRNYKKYDQNRLQTILSETSWIELFTSIDVNKACSIFEEKLLMVFDSVAPIMTKRVKGKPSPWLNSEIKAAMNTRDYLLRKYRKSKNEIHHNDYKRKRNEVNKMIRKSKSSHNIRILEETAGNPDKFWRSVKRIYPSKSKSDTKPQSFDINGENTTNMNKNFKCILLLFYNNRSENERKYLASL